MAIQTNPDCVPKECLRRFFAWPAVQKETDALPGAAVDGGWCWFASVDPFSEIVEISASSGAPAKVAPSMVDYIVEKLLAIFGAVPALFLEEGSPNVYIVRVMFALMF